MTSTKHLNAIKAKCHELLAIAEKRTPGRWLDGWELGPSVSCDWQHLVGGGHPIVSHSIGFSEGGITALAPESRDSAFIASAAGPFEASLRSTIAAIDGLSRLEDWKFTGWDGDAGIRSEASAVLDDILSAWPIELL